MSFLVEQLVANGGSGSPSTLGRIIASKAIFDFITNDSISAIEVDSSSSPARSGSGYVVGETFDITIAGSPQEVFTAVGVVTEIDHGGSPEISPVGQVTGVKIVSGGAYSDLMQLSSPEGDPILGQATTNASASGTGLVVDVTPEEAHWTQDRGFGAASPLPATDYSNDSSDFEWICTSLKASNAPTIGLKTGVTTNGYARLMTATGFSKIELWNSQPGRNPTSGSGESVLPMPSTNPQIYVSSTERRVNICIRDGAFSHYGILGLFIPYTDSAANYPFAGMVAGTTVGALAFNVIRDSISAAPSTVASGVVSPMALQNGTSTGCPYWYRDNLSPSWFTICESTAEESNLIAQMWPNQSNLAQYDFTFAAQVSGKGTDPNGGAASAQAGAFADESLGWFGSADGGGEGVPGIAPLGLQNRASIVVQPHIIKNQTSDVQAIGILDGFEAVHGRGLTSFEEIVQPNNGKRYIVFNDVNSGDLWRWVAMEIV